MIKYLIFDTETNAKEIDGRFTYKQDIIELCYIGLDKDFNIVEEYSTMIRNVADKIYKNQTVYDYKDILDGKDFQEVFDRFYFKLEEVKRNSGFVIAHNIRFDRSAIYHSAKKIGIEKSYLNKYWKMMEELGFCNMLETMRFCNLKGKRGIKWPKLQELYDILYPDNPFIQTHKALDDVEQLILCIRKCLELNVYNLN